MSEKIPFSFTKLPDKHFSFQAGGFFSGWKVLVDDQVLPKKKGKLLLQDPQRGELIIEPKVGLDFLSPAFIFDGEKVYPREPLPWYLNVLALAPLGLIAVGGAIGGLFGGLAYVANMKILHSQLPIALRILIPFFVASAAILSWVIAAGVISAMLQ